MIDNDAVKKREGSIDLIFFFSFRVWRCAVVVVLLVAVDDSAQNHFGDACRSPAGVLGLLCSVCSREPARVGILSIIN